MNKPSIFFDDFLHHEIEKTARLRAIILIGLLVFEGLALLIVYLLFSEEYTSIFKSKIAINALLIYAFVIIAFELIVHFLVRVRSNVFNLRTKFSTYFITFLEIALLSLLMILVMERTHEPAILQSPAIFTYFILIILSTLHLDFRVSIFSGILAAFEYIGISYYYTHILPVSLVKISTIQYLGQGIMMVTAGIAAAYMAKLIKSKVYTSLENIEKRNEAINLFGQQISPNIATELLKNPTNFNGIRRNVTVMFLDIRNFTPFVENKEPEEVVNYLNSLFGFMVKIVQSRNGIINQFLGDGFMATFGAPITVKNSSNDARLAAEEIITVVEDKVNRKEIPATRLGIGIHFGKAVTGNIGSEERKQYSITGNVVILASRIEQLNRKYNSQLLISKEVYSQIDTKGQKLYTPLGHADVKGRKSPILIYKYTELDKD